MGDPLIVERADGELVRLVISEEVTADLYAALEVLLSSCDAHDEANSRQMIDPHSEQHARDALAKARGEQ